MKLITLKSNELSSLRDRCIDEIHKTAPYDTKRKKEIITNYLNDVQERIIKLNETVKKNVTAKTRVIDRSQFTKDEDGKYRDKNGNVVNILEF